jgi:hypothetical protein
MIRSRVTTTLLIALLTAPLALIEIACSRAPEQQFLTQFFRAARARDNATLAMMSAVSFDPRERGTVEEFDIASVGPEQRTPLDFKALIEAENKAREAEAEFAKRKKEYQDANLEAIEEVLKLERDPKARLSPAQMKVKAEWDKWREDTSVYAKASAAARSARVSSGGPAEASLTQPGAPEFDPSQFEGDLVTKAVTLNAQVRSPDGQLGPKTLVVTMQRAVGKQGGQERTGRWVITRIDET